MKTLIISIIFILTATVLSAQEVTVLDEARLFYAPLNVVITQDGDSYVYNIKESQSRQFARDPIGFMKANFDIQSFITHTADKKYHAYLVTFKSSNGSLEADFDSKGRLLETRQQFKNVILPANLRSDVHKAYQGYTLTKTKYTARTKGEILANAKYKIRLENGKDKQHLKIDAISSGVGVAVN
ncbi:hypothetical protein K8089_09385 [Aequorivita sp. F47161]|uniref:Nicotinic acid mononucleotide adenyltransferase n=1 Tax=Aequorivita vitellina TaxID=2874475 RepID=A0A9X1QZ45_9FLAO|nr:hypothetical protein [Aequorivita vitellina]MCG2419234.1 hypothetical protein [Aequorivita vitellina]